MNPLRAYLDTQKQTASTERLMVMLFEAALRNIRDGAAALEAGRKTSAGTPLGKAAEIVEYLTATLDPRQDTGLCENLADLYAFVGARLARASSGHDAGAAREAERVLAPIASAFTQAVAKLERGQPGAAR